MAVKFTNNAFATLASSLTNVATTASLSAGQGARFPTLSAGDYCYATIVDLSNNQEIVKVTARSTDTLTIVRAADSTTARAFSAGDRVELRVTAASLSSIVTDLQTEINTASGDLTAHINDTTAAHAASAISFSATGGVAATNVQTAIAEVDTEKANKTITISAGTGLTGGGDLSANRTISLASGSNGIGTRTVSTAAPSGGSDGDIWYQV
jgi:fermentation-respiration switch protein FrsA (DUF1100 family)